MEKLIVCGGKKLNGRVKIHGAKNAALPILCATLLCNEKVILHNCPKLSDVNNTLDILQHFGCKIVADDDTLIIEPFNNMIEEIPDYLMQKMRSSIIFLGAMLAKNKKAKLSFPGGCELGPRPIDIHLNCFEKLGVTINEHNSEIVCEVNDCIKGCSLNLPFPSVGATENVILASVFSKGTTRIYNAAREPEIVDLADFLNKCGANIKGAGESLVEINGVKKLSGCEHTIIPDRIEASTYMCFSAVTGGDIVLDKICCEHIEPVFFAFREAGCEIRENNNTLRIVCPERLNKISQVKSLVYPGFPTDSGLPLIAMCSVAKGTSVFVETIFQNRYKSVGDLNKMGANIKIFDSIAVIEGVNSLHGADVCATDLRGGVALVTAALAANGVSRISGLNHIDRGYENLEANLRLVGADVIRK